MGNYSQNSWKTYFSGRCHKIWVFCSFSQSRNPGIKASPIPGLGLRKWPRIRDPGIGIPSLEPVTGTAQLQFLFAIYSCDLIFVEIIIKNLKD